MLRSGGQSRRQACSRDDKLARMRRGARRGRARRLRGAASARARPAAFDLDDLERRTFDWFWDTRQPGQRPRPRPLAVEELLLDRRGRLRADRLCRSASSAAGSAAPQARDRTLATLRFFANAPQGPEATGRDRAQGLLLPLHRHGDTGARFETTELSSIDTALLLGGMLFAARIFRPRRSRRGGDPPPRRR